MATQREIKNEEFRRKEEAYFPTFIEKLKAIDNLPDLVKFRSSGPAESYPGHKCHSRLGWWMDNLTPTVDTRSEEREQYLRLLPLYREAGLINEEDYAEKGALLGNV